MQSIVEPALRDWGAIIVAPDVPDERWASERSERALLALMDHVVDRHGVDRARILVTGFSMGGRGAWYMATRHADLFTGVIVMATGPGDGPLENLSETPLYIIHSPDDEVVPYPPVEALALQLAARGYPVQMMRLPGANHGMMGDYVTPLATAGEWLWRQWDTNSAQSR
jgi:predicted peptidase